MKRVTIFLVLILSITTIIELLKLPTFALPQNGDISTTDYVDTLVGSDGKYFYRGGVQTSIKYNPDGSTSSFLHENYNGTRRHYLIMPDGEANYYGYCIEQGVSFPDAQRYNGVGWINDSYFSKLPTTVQTGIMLATMFGWQPGKNVPVSGCNDSDWYWATQVIIWEYQQQLRSSPTNIQGNGYVSANYFQSTLAGRPAEKCYNDILASMAKYQVIPSFTATDSTNAALNVLKWDSIKQLWCVTVNDSNQIGQPLSSDDSTIKIEQNGNQYNFSSTTEFNIKTVKFRKNVPLPSHELLIWGGANRTQAISTGAADPIQFFGQFRTEKSGTFEIVKSSEDGEKEGFLFKIMDQNGQSTNLITNQEGLASTQLYPGEYMVSEEETKKYRIPQNQTIEIKENEITRLELVNILKKGQVRIKKNVIDTIASKTIGEKGAGFQIYSANYSAFDGTPKNLRDEFTTDDQGVATSQELPLGNYLVHQKVAGKNITISKDIPVTIENDMRTILLPIDNLLQNGKIQVFKMNKSKLPLSGAEFIVRAVEDILQADGTLKYSKGYLIGTLITDINGSASTEWLYPGKYEIEEVKAPAGYMLPDNPFTSVLLTAENQNAITFLKQITIENAPVEQRPNPVVQRPTTCEQSYNTVEKSPSTGDVIRRTSTRVLLILMLMSLIGIGFVAFMMREKNKTLH